MTEQDVETVQGWIDEFYHFVRKGLVVLEHPKNVDLPVIVESIKWIDGAVVIECLTTGCTCTYDARAIGLICFARYYREGWQS